MSQVVEYLQCQREALDSTLSTTKKKKEGREERREDGKEEGREGQIFLDPVIARAGCKSKRGLADHRWLALRIVPCT
jgi:hypothetical protein